MEEEQVIGTTIGEAQEKTVEQIQQESEEKQQRINECGKALTELLKKYNCALDPAIVLRENQVLPQLRIVAK